MEEVVPSLSRRGGVPQQERAAQLRPVLQLDTAKAQNHKQLEMASGRGGGAPPTLRDAVSLDPSLGDYCEWRRRVLQKKERNTSVQTGGQSTEERLGDQTLQQALNLKQAADSAVHKLHACGLNGSKEIERIEAMKMRIARLGD